MIYCIVILVMILIVLLDMFNSKWVATSKNILVKIIPFLLIFFIFLLVATTVYKDGYYEETEVSLESNIEHWLNQEEKPLVYAEEKKLVIREKNFHLIYRMMLWPFNLELDSAYVLYTNTE